MGATYVWTGFLLFAFILSSSQFLYYTAAKKQLDRRMSLLLLIPIPCLIAVLFTWLVWKSWPTLITTGLITLAALQVLHYRLSKLPEHPRAPMT
ncbi:MAG: hypothetical protein K1X67_13700 [Fimbriimonadaceae bacterium]|nr:hypothetical protein [Fimbriimonadaceae bacterium]